MKKESKKLSEIFARYIFLALVSIPNLWLFYFVFTPLTMYPIYHIFSLFYGTSIAGKFLIINEIPIEFIDACIAGSAYYLLLILIFSTSDIQFKKRLFMTFIAFLSLLLINLVRITVLILVLFYGYSFFDITHKFFWYLMSTIFVVLIWFAEVKYFKIKKVPLYSDIKFLIKKMRWLMLLFL